MYHDLVESKKATATTLPQPPSDLAPDAHALFLDFDGTLVDIADRPDGIHIPSDLPDLLARLHARFDGRVAIVSGRTYAELERFLPGFSGPVWSSHGGALHHGGHLLVERDLPDAIAPLQEAAALFCDTLDGVHLEAKSMGFALHFRADPNAEPAVRTFLEGLVGPHPEMTLQSAKMAWEVLPVGVSKGDAVRATVERFGWRDAAPIFIGDDITDLAGMRAAGALSGFGIAVGEHRAEARYSCSDPSAVRAMLSDWAG